ncbi:MULTISPECIES: ABC transporter substrate-binding protein [Streptomyces]|uniref:ABC transporter substrate-binding protein n=1 Tax=Streptomyces TaxID=1883 RepID=UPI000C26E513|nr:ABC transporter substrate-binding protein [Streptomyces sp. CB01201]MBX7465735.1 peptide-binding protein [Streptomyces sp. MAG02]PJN02947.1 peptide-binding protein [Streptomyces sp. CB01201]
MRSIRMRIMAIGAAVVVAGVGGWQLLPSDQAKKDPIAVGTTDVITSLDPAGAYDAGSWAIYNNVYQSLLTFRQGSTTPVPDAAKSCAFVGQKLTTYQCVMRDDISFSSGRKMTAEDVKYSFDRMLKIADKLGPAPLFSMLGSVQAQGDTVTFNLKSKDATFPSKLATGAGSIVDSSQYPANALRKDDSVVGSGPYLLKEYKKDASGAPVSASLEPNTGYKGAVTKQGMPITVRYFAEADQLNAAWQAKQVDVAHREMPPQVLAKLSPGADVRISTSPGYDIRQLTFNLKSSSPVSKTKVREAAAALVDRAALASNVYLGTVDPLFSVIPQGFTGHSTAFFDAYPKPDPVKAKSLLRSAGESLPVTFNMAYRKLGANGAEAEQIKTQLEKDGLFKVNLIAEPDWPKMQQNYAEGKYDAYTAGWLADFPDPDNFGAPLVGTGNSLHNNYSDKTVDDLIKSTQEFTDRGRAADDFKAIQEKVAQDVPLIPLWQGKNYVLGNKDVSGSQYLSDGTGVWRLWELGWI